eukprot:scaffold679911_cov64-Prasinocladus_malaysianus.AAC.1
MPCCLHKGRNVTCQSLWVLVRVREKSVIREYEYWQSCYVYEYRCRWSAVRRVTVRCYEYGVRVVGGRSSRYGTVEPVTTGTARRSLYCGEMTVDDD